MDFGPQLLALTTEMMYRGCRVSLAFVEWRTTYWRDRIEPDFGDCFEYEKGGFISYIPKARLDKVGPSDVWESNLRQHVKPAKLFRRFLTEAQRCYTKAWGSDPEPLTDNDFEKFSGMIRSYDEMIGSPVEIVRGQAITDWYSYDVVDTRSPQSCMTGRHGSIQAYAEQPESVGLAIVHELGKLRARALVWETTEGTKHDRIYGDGVAYRRLIRWFEEQGIPETDGGYETAEVELARPWASNGYSPYMDTFRGAAPGCRVLKAGPHHECAACGDELTEEDAIYSEIAEQYYCQPCADRRWCNRCSAVVDHRTDNRSGTDYYDQLCDDCIRELGCRECGRASDDVPGCGYCEECRPLVCDDCGLFDPNTEDGLCPGCRPEEELAA